MKKEEKRRKHEVNDDEGQMNLRSTIGECLNGNSAAAKRGNGPTQPSNSQEMKPSAPSRLTDQHVRDPGAVTQAKKAAAAAEGASRRPARKPAAKLAEAAHEKPDEKALETAISPTGATRPERGEMFADPALAASTVQKFQSIEVRSNEVGTELREILDQLRRQEAENQRLIKRNRTLEAQTAQSIEAVERSNRQIERLNQQIKDQRTVMALDLAARLGGLLSTLADFTGQGPEITQGITGEGVFNAALDSFKELTGIRPDKFPDKRELQNIEDGGWLITLDADQLGVEALQGKYDWGEERPFEGLPDGQKKRTFRLLHWGWRIGDRVIAPAVITSVTGKDQKD